MSDLLCMSCGGRGFYKLDSDRFRRICEVCKGSGHTAPAVPTTRYCEHCCKQVPMEGNHTCNPTVWEDIDTSVGSEGFGFPAPECNCASLRERLGKVKKALILADEWLSDDDPTWAPKKGIKEAITALREILGELK